LKSILQQDIDKNEYEIIIINDGSTDKGLEIVNKYASDYNNISVYSQENKGLGAVRNRGVQLARGKYTYFIDSDDYLADNTLGAIVKLAENHELEVLGFKSKLTNIYTEKQSLTNNNVLSSAITISDGITYMANTAFKNEVWWYIIKREFLLETGIQFIENRWMEDTIFTSSLFLKTQRMAAVPIDAHRYVDIPTSAMNNKEPSHYSKIIYDSAYAAIYYDNRIKELLGKDDLIHKKCIARLKTRQESFVFFLIIRAMQSNLSLKQLEAILIDMKKIGAYPMKNFISKEYKDLKFKIITKIFNSPLLLALAFNFFKFTKRFF
jgi:glycosyltransferase involved in cell wall biosynthesis